MLGLFCFQRGLIYGNTRKKICPNCRGVGIIKTAVKFIDCPVCGGSKKFKL